MPLAAEELADLLTERLGGHVVASEIQWGQLTVTLDADGYREAARFCRDDERLACDLFDCIAGVDEREDGFSIVTILYSTEHHHRVLLRHPCDGGRDAPTAPSLTDLYRGADWHEREAWEMFGFDFEGHPSLRHLYLPSEFEGFPLRKDFPLLSRAVKPWPGLVDKEPIPGEDEGAEEGASA